jgi:hypothetical protein
VALNEVGLCIDPDGGNVVQLDRPGVRLHSLDGQAKAALIDLQTHGVFAVIDEDGLARSGLERSLVLGATQAWCWC